MIQFGDTNITLHNRDGARLWLERVKEIEPNIFEYRLNVDYNHKYCLEYMRYIYDEDGSIRSIDPSGGPSISIGDEFENKYKIVKINSVISIWISERNNN